MHAQGVMRCILFTSCSLDRSEGFRPAKAKIWQPFPGSLSDIQMNSYLPTVTFGLGEPGVRARISWPIYLVAMSSAHPMLQPEKQLTSPGISSSLGRSKSRPQTMSPSCCSSRMVSRAQK